MLKTAPQLIRIGHSPDPDDAFMFYALAKGKIPLRGFQIQHVVEDIESLNQRALNGELEVTAVSCHAYAYLADRYLVLRAGASVGDRYGPILVAPREKADGPVKGKRVAVPGRRTTAYLVLQLLERDFVPVFVPFDQVFEAVKTGRADLGLVIHEGQITYGQHGLRKVHDLGQWWWEQTRLPLPLGVDIIRRDLGEEAIRRFAGLFKESIEYALANRAAALDYAIAFGRGLREDLNDRFVGMYVNHYTVDLGPSGVAGFHRLLEWGSREGLIPSNVSIEFEKG